MNITVDDAYLVALLREVEKTSFQSVAKSLAVGAGVMCRAMNQFTWPKTQEEMDNAIFSQVRKVYAHPSDIATALNKDRRGTGSKFFTLMKRGLSERAIAILRASRLPYKELPFGNLNPIVHKQSRNRRGRVELKAPAMGLLKTGKTELSSYIKKKQKMAGFTKAGWYKCLRLLGGRNTETETESGKGMPVFSQYVKRHGSKAAGVVDGKLTGQRQYITAINQTPWADQATSPRARSFVEGVARRRFVKYLETKLSKDLQRQSRQRRSNG